MANNVLVTAVPSAEVDVTVIVTGHAVRVAVVPMLVLEHACLIVLVPPMQEKSYSGIASRVTIVYFIYTQYNPSSQSPPQSMCE